MDARETAELAEIRQRLTADFGGVLDDDEIQQRLDDAVARFDGASIRMHVMLLIERRATADLRVAVAKAAGSTAEISR